MRTQIEADLLIQNLFLVAEAMGLGAWIHGSMSPPVLMGDPKFVKQYGPMLGFDFVVPKWKLADLLRWQVPLPRYANLRSNAVGLRHKGEHLIKGSAHPITTAWRRRSIRGRGRQVRAGRHLQRHQHLRQDLPRPVRRNLP